MESLGKTVILFGVILIVLGAGLMFAHKIPFLGKLPGDIYIKKDNFSFYFPVATSLLLSILISAVFYFVGRR